MQREYTKVDVSQPDPKIRCNQEQKNLEKPKEKQRDPEKLFQILSHGPTIWQDLSNIYLLLNQIDRPILCQCVIETHSLRKTNAFVLMLEDLGSISGSIWCRLRESISAGVGIEIR